MNNSYVYLDLVDALDSKTLWRIYNSFTIISIIDLGNTYEVGVHTKDKRGVNQLYKLLKQDGYISTFEEFKSCVDIEDKKRVYDNY